MAQSAIRYTPANRSDGRSDDLKAVNILVPTVSPSARNVVRERTYSNGTVGNILRKMIHLRVAIFLNIGLLATIVIMAVIWAKEKKTMEIISHKDNQTTTTTTTYLEKEVLEEAYKLLSAMDASVDPCEDFYEYACGNWMLDNEADDDWTSVANIYSGKKRIMAETRRILETFEMFSPVPVQKVKLLFRECMDTEKLDSAGLEPLIEVLQMLGLPGQVPSVDTIADFDITKTLALINLHVPMQNFMLDTLFFTDQNLPRSANRKLLAITGYDGTTFLGKEDDVILDREADIWVLDELVHPAVKYFDEFVNYAASVLRVFEKIKPTKMFTFQLRLDALDILSLEVDLKKLFHENMARDIEDGIKVEKFIADLQRDQEDFNLTMNYKNVINFTEYIETIMMGKEDFMKEEVIVNSVPYFTALNRKLAVTDTVNIQLYIWWKVVDQLLMYTTKELREIHKSKPSIVLGQQQTDRTEECLKLMSKLMNNALSHKIATMPDMAYTRKVAEEMFIDVKNAFLSLLEEADWMDEKTKKQAFQKAKVMDHVIGVPDYLLDVSYVNRYYAGLVIKPGQFLKSVTTCMKHNWKTEVRELGKPYNATKYMRNAFSSFSINAFYDRMLNKILLPLGVLHPPTFITQLRALSYAKGGCILGHELTHGFDNNGRQLDGEGLIRNWWSEKTKDNFLLRGYCFTAQYHRYKIGKAVQINVDGLQTIDENLADNSGLRQAYRAFHMKMKRDGTEIKLPGLEHLSSDQLFFLSFGNLWCTNDNKFAELARISDIHSPARARVIGTLSNMDEFSKAWSCPKGSPMNPKQKCRLW